MENRKRRKRLSSEERDEIVAMYSDPSVTMQEIMEKFNVSKPTISTIGHLAGLNRARQWTEEEIKLILRRDELGINTIAERLNAKPDVIRALYAHYSKRNC